MKRLCGVRAAAGLLLAVVAVCAAMLFARETARAGEASEEGLAALSWIAGSWRGDYDKGGYDEQWTESEAGCMTGMFRWVHDGKVRVHEFLLLEEDAEGGVHMRLRHFGAGMKAWEEAPMVFTLVERKGQDAVFKEEKDGVVKTLRYAIEDSGTLLVALTEPGRDGKDHTFEFRFKRVGG